MKSFLILLFIVGFYMIIVGYIKNHKKCPQPKIEYRYIPRTFYEEQMQPTNVLKSFNAMFKDKSVWSSYPLNSVDTINNETLE